MKKSFNLIFTAVFFLICCLPLACKPFAGESKSIGNEQENFFPALLTSEGVNQNFSDECNSWFSRENALRVPLINTENTLKLTLAKSSSNGVIQGKNGYLFSEESVDDFLGVTMSKRELFCVAKTVCLTQEYAQQNGAAFLFAVTPNKNSVYPQYMPDRYLQGDESNFSKLQEYFVKLGVNYVDLKTELQSHNEELYLRDDTHWNHLGALYGYNAMMNALNRDDKIVDKLSYMRRNDWTGDLTKMAFPNSGRACSQYYFDYPLGNCTFMQPKGSDANALLEELMDDSEKRDGMIKTVNSDAQGSLYMLRDSFGRALLPYCIGNYHNTCITRYQPLNLMNMSYTDVVWQTAERKLNTVINSAPKLFAAQRGDVSVAQSVLSSQDNRAAADSALPDCISICGTVSKEMLETESCIYVILQSPSNTLIYEAFPIYEKDILGGDNCGNGFSLTIDKTALPKGEYAVFAQTDKTLPLNPTTHHNYN